MIEIICKDGEFLAKGTVTLGLAGTYENKDFGEEHIEIRFDLAETLKELNKEDSYFFKPLMPYLKDIPRDGDSIAKGLSEYYNQKENEAEKHVKEINDCLLYHLFENLEACEYPFWEIEDTVIPGSLDGIDPEETVYTKMCVYDYKKFFYETPNNGTIEKIDLEAKLREGFPMFNFDALYENIEPEGISLSGRFLEFQFSDKWGATLYECAYDRFDENFTSCDWHNH